MSDDNKKTLRMPGARTGNDAANSGQIRQSFSHGRSKVVTVEVKKKRVFNKDRSPQAVNKDKASVLAKKTGLTSVELENRLKAVRELAGAHMAEAQRRADSAHENVSSRIASIESEKAKQEEALKIKAEQAAAEAKQKAEKEAAEKAAKTRQREEIRSDARKSSPGDRQSDRFNGARQQKQDRLERGDRKGRGDKPFRTDKKQSGQEQRSDKARFGDRTRPSGQRPGFGNNTNRSQGTSQSQYANRFSGQDSQFKPDFSNFNSESDNKRQAQKKSYGSSERTFDDEDNSSKNQKNSMQIKRGKDEILSRSMERKGKISIYNALDEDENDSFRRSGQKNKQKAKNTINDDIQKIVREVLIPDTISVQELSNRMAVRVADLIKALMKMGIMATINQAIDADTAELIVLEMGHKVKRVGDADIVSELISEIEDTEEDMLPRPPIVTIMGHVDHGKTSLLDAIRKTDVALNEAGGITQHIGAYQITMKNSRKITFIDTPGHAAFTEMRARGANITDVVVLVVAADDGVKEQTVEALNHAKAAGVPIIIAINKIDKPGANPDRVRNDLLNYEIVVEALGGDVIDVEVSAKSGINLDLLEDSILLQADVLDLKANPNRSAEATVVEARVEKGLGPVATVLVNKGTLKVGDVFVAGMVSGKVRAIRNDLKQNLSELLPGSPGEIIGFSSAPIPGDDFIVVQDESKAKEIAEIRARKKKEKEWVIKRGAVSDAFAQAASGEKIQSVAVIIKADTQGSIEAISESLRKLATDEVQVNILHSGVGGITENDVILANASNAVVLGFNVRANMQAKDQSSRDGIELKYYSVIYDLIDDVKAIMSGMLAPTLSERVIGSAEVRQIFDISKIGKIAGCMVTDGVIRKTAKVRILRDNVVIHTGNVKSLQRKKDAVKEIKEGFECGISLESYSDIHIKDVIEFFEIDEIARTL